MTVLIFCAICGARIWNEELDSSQTWLSKVALLECDGQNPPSTSVSSRIVSPYVNRLEPETWDAQARQFVRRGLKMFRARDTVDPESQSDAYDGKCYPMHINCNLVFEFLVGRFRADQEGCKETLYWLFDTAPYDEYQLLLPHDYGVDGGAGALREYAELGRPPHAGSSSLSPGGPPLGYVDEDIWDPVAWSNLPLRWKEKFDMMAIEFGVSFVGRIQGDGLSIPKMFPLPVELTLKILSYLSGSDIMAFGAVDYEGAERLLVPDFVWKAQFAARAEAGHVNDTKLYGGMMVASGTARFLTWRMDRGLPAMKNRRRIWDICLMLMDTVADVRQAEVCNIEKGEIHHSFEAGFGGAEEFLVEATPQTVTVADDGRELCDGVCTVASGSIGPLTATGVLVSYTGSGAMRFASGLKFLPGEEKIGLVNPHDQVYLPLSSKGAEAENLVFHVAASKYGIRSATVKKAGEKPSWKLTGVTVLERTFRAGTTGIDIAEVAVGVDVSKITRLGVRSAHFVSV
ncbi:hypothetical protein DRE_07263 [Drechslerella stenobrocha 248]|uniref:F-box domain-containing protein n=1 Tax=Drechslerella stenobrocha 248 TaxID=1043628 RepID=W7HIX6_9PEZI|nr:hypothetical protein DRE_07263 [Drechslerella stenobrocha 248]